MVDFETDHEQLRSEVSGLLGFKVSEVSLQNPSEFHKRLVLWFHHPDIDEAD